MRDTCRYPEVSVHNIVCQAVSCCSNQGRKILQEWVSFQKAQFCNILSSLERWKPGRGGGGGMRGGGSGGGVGGAGGDILC